MGFGGSIKLSWMCEPHIWTFEHQFGICDVSVAISFLIILEFVPVINLQNMMGHVLCILPVQSIKSKPSLHWGN